MKIIPLILFSLIFIGQAQARQLEDVEFEEQISLTAGDSPLKLNGLGIRYKFFFKIYIAALYVEKLTHKADDLISAKGAKRIRMYFLYDEVSKEKLVNGWLEGFQNNLGEQEFQDLESRIKQFNAMFETVNRGDQILLDYLPTKGTRVTIKNKLRGTIEGADFYAALMKIWLGDSPVKEDLKNALLGIEEDDF